MHQGTPMTESVTQEQVFYLIVQDNYMTQLTGNPTSPDCPWSPMGPGNPCSPFWPGGPGEPSRPGVPLSPSIPGSPVKPRSPRQV